MVVKESYTPSQTKRFEISSDPISQERFKAVVGTVKELQEYTPLISVSLWGSLSKGKTLTPETALTSDIELVAFYDVEGASNIPSYQDGTFDGLLSDTLESGIKARLEPNGDSPQMNISVGGIALEGSNSVLGLVMRLIGNKEIGEVELNRHLTTLSAFFGLDITGDLKPYRESFFQQVSQTIPDDADKLWKFISEDIIKLVERGVRGTSEAFIPPAIEQSFPATFDEAVHYYSENSSNQMETKESDHPSPQEP